jgi:penicillin-binding protein 1B
VVTAADNGDVLAVVGSRDPSAQGFNRALEARRPIGSLVKPAIYLHALETEEYTLASTLLDSAISLREPNGRSWQPQNFDKKFRGPIPMFRALMDSRNLPTVRLGLDLGLEGVIETLHRLGLTFEIEPYPSLLLGAIAAAPIDVAAMYTTLASGRRARPRVVKEVLSAGNERLSRYAPEIETAFSPALTYQIGRTLQEATHSGTSRALADMLPEDLEVTGKTGTTDDLRDSWFAGYSGDRVAVVWVGRDDNAPVGLTGASGALRIWGRLMRAVAHDAYAPRRPPRIDEVWVDAESGLRSCEDCAGAIRLPFPEGRGPEGDEPLPRAFRWFRDLFR